MMLLQPPPTTTLRETQVTFPLDDGTTSQNPLDYRKAVTDEERQAVQKAWEPLLRRWAADEGGSVMIDLSEVGNPPQLPNGRKGLLRYDLIANLAGRELTATGGTVVLAVPSPGYDRRRNAAMLAALQGLGPQKAGLFRTTTALGAYPASFALAMLRHLVQDRRAAEVALTEPEQFELMASGAVAVWSGAPRPFVATGIVGGGQSVPEREEVRPRLEIGVLPVPSLAGGKEIVPNGGGFVTLRELSRLVRKETGENWRYDLRLGRSPIWVKGRFTPAALRRAFLRLSASPAPEIPTRDLPDPAFARWLAGPARGLFLDAPKPDGPVGAMVTPDGQKYGPVSLAGIVDGATMPYGRARSTVMITDTGGGAPADGDLVNVWPALNLALMPPLPPAKAGATSFSFTSPYVCF